MPILLCAVFFVSGAAGLIFEALWFRQTGLAFGNSVTASSLVLASFMSGLALGSACVARWGPRLARPLHAYAALEVAIALGGVAIVWGLPSVSPALASLEQRWAEAPTLLHALRLGCAFGLLLIPATAMGATLPVLVGTLRSNTMPFGAALGQLYSWNTLGAVAGAIAAETIVVPTFGVRGAAVCAGALDIAAAIAALLIARQLSSTGEIAADPRARSTLTSRATALLIAAALAGATLLAFEVVWFRFLRLFVHTGSLAFALMLASVLSGIGVGGGLAGAWLRRRSATSSAAPALACSAGALSVALYAGMASLVGEAGQPLIFEWPRVLTLAACLTLPVSLISGALFTLTGAALREHIPHDSRAAGWLTMANTLGAGAGSLCAGFVLLPAFGMERSLFGLASLYGVVALLLWYGCGVHRRLRVSDALAASALGAALAFFPFGLMQSTYMRFPIERFAKAPRAQPAALLEGRGETVILLRKELDGETLNYRLITDGYSMAANSVRARRYMKLYAYFPLALGFAPRDVLLISYGAGSTARALAELPSVEAVDVVDISREILSLSSVIYPNANDDPLRDPRFHVYVEDGRHFLQTSTRRYDLITGEPPPPKAAGVVNLYTREYFSLVRDRLTQGGLHTYWLPVHNLTAAEAQSIVRAYCDVFSDCTLWQGWGYDWMLVGSRDADWQARGVSSEPWNDPRTGPELVRLGLEHPQQIAATFLADSDQLAEWSRNAPPLVDDHPGRLTHRMPSIQETRADFAGWLDSAASRARFARSRFVNQVWDASERRLALHAFGAHSLIEAPAREPNWPGDLVAQFERVHQSLEHTRLTTLPLWLLGSDGDRSAAVERLIAAGASERQYAADLGRAALAERRYSDAAQRFAQARAARPRDRSLLRLQLYCLLQAGETESATRLARASGRHPSETQWWRWLDATFGASGGTE